VCVCMCVYACMRECAFVSMSGSIRDNPLYVYTALKPLFYLFTSLFTNFFFGNGSSKLLYTAINGSRSSLTEIELYEAVFNVTAFLDNPLPARQ